MVFSKHGKNDGIAVYIPKETILMEMAAKIKLSQHFFFWPSLGTFQQNLVCMHAPSFIDLDQAPIKILLAKIAFTCNERVE
jgi:hypothetical protein